MQELDQVQCINRNSIRAILGSKRTDFTLLNLLVRHRSWKSTGERDKVYAPLGLGTCAQN